MGADPPHPRYEPGGWRHPAGGTCPASGGGARRAVAAAAHRGLTNLAKPQKDPRMLKKLKKLGRSTLVQDTRGLTTVEYIVLLCLVVVVGFGVWKKFGGKVQEKVGG